MKSYRVVQTFLNFIEVEVPWLDELAEGLRNVVASSHLYRNWIDSLPAQLQWKAQNFAAHKVIIETMRRSCYTLGVAADQLIVPKEKSEEEKKKEEEERKLKKEQKVDLQKLDMLHGGLERRFIPELSEKTK